MKIIDHTPFFNPNSGEISVLDRGKAMLKFGNFWIKEVEAQKQIIPILEKVLDKNYTLLRNITPPGLDASFPFILVGPPGVFVMVVTPLTGMFRAKGDQWGTVSGNNFINEKPNLLTRTERMARVIQVFLRRQGYLEMVSADAILLCSDLSLHVDSVRPIIRVVMRDALERFAISIAQARVVLSPESVLDVVNRILNPPKPALPPTAETHAYESPQGPSISQVEDPYVPAFALPESQVPVSSYTADLPVTAGTEDRTETPVRKGLSKKQWGVLISLFVFWCFLITLFLYLVIREQGSFILSLMP